MKVLSMCRPFFNMAAMGYTKILLIALNVQQTAPVIRLYASLLCWFNKMKLVCHFRDSHHIRIWLSWAHLKYVFYVNSQRWVENGWYLLLRSMFHMQQENGFQDGRHGLSTNSTFSLIMPVDSIWLIDNLYYLLMNYIEFGHVWYGIGMSFSKYVIFQIWPSYFLYIYR